MTKRYYYDCPIEAIYMAKNFGISFVNVEYFDLAGDIYHYSIEVCGKDKTQSPYYVAPESEHVFVPQYRDKGVANTKFNDYVCFSLAGWRWNRNNHLLTPKEIEQLKIKITYRNRKHFFMPKVEEIDDNI